MKKKLMIVAMLFAPFAVTAQDMYWVEQNRFPRDFLAVPAAILVVCIIISFLLNTLRSIQDYRLKSKMIERGVSEKVVEQFLQPRDRDVKSQAIKWFLILAGIGVGSTIISFTLPIGIHSIAIMAFSIALSFLGYFYFMKQSHNR